MDKALSITSEVWKNAFLEAGVNLILSEPPFVKLDLLGGVGVGVEEVTFLGYL